LSPGVQDQHGQHSETLFRERGGEKEKEIEGGRERQRDRDRERERE
jgi:hypothetical protein